MRDRAVETCLDVLTNARVNFMLVKKRKLLPRENSRYKCKAVYRYIANINDVSPTQL